MRLCESEHSEHIAQSHSIHHIVVGLLLVQRRHFGAVLLDINFYQSFD